MSLFSKLLPRPFRPLDVAAPAAPADVTCQHCRWWHSAPQLEKRDGQPMGECRQRAPRVFQMTARDGQPVVTRWPVTRTGDACGDFRPRF